MPFLIKHITEEEARARVIPNGVEPKESVKGDIILMKSEYDPSVAFEKAHFRIFKEGSGTVTRVVPSLLFTKYLIDLEKAANAQI